MPAAASEGARRLRHGRLRPGRAGLLVAVALAHAGLLALLMRSGVVPAPPAAERLILFEVLAPPPTDPPPPPPPEPPPPAPAARAAPPAKLARPKPPPPEATPRPAPVPPEAPAGPDPAAGAASQGAGTGLAGAGEGAGAGSSGTGSGGGRARWQSGSITPRDYPRGLSRAGLGGSVTVALEIGADGRVTDCAVTGSSGLAELDATTCRLIRARFRYRPATDAAGNPVPGRAAWRQDWWLEPRGSGGS